LEGRLASFVEIYGPRIPVEEIPAVTVTLGNLRVNGDPIENPSATAIYPKDVPDYAEAVAKDGRIVVKIGKPMERSARQVRLLPNE
jgi:hypothetical protein